MLTDNWNGHSRRSIAWLEMQAKALENLYDPNQDIDLIGLSDMLRDDIYNLETTAELAVERFMRSLISLALVRDKNFLRYHKIDSRNAMYSVENVFYNKDNREYLKDHVAKKLQDIYSELIENYENYIFEEEEINPEDLKSLPKKVPWTIEDLIEKGVNKLAMVLIDSMGKNN